MRGDIRAYPLARPHHGKQHTADRLGLDLVDHYDVVSETVSDLRAAGYSHRQISNIPIED